MYIALSAMSLSLLNIQGSYPLKLLVMSCVGLCIGLSGMLGVLVGGNWLLATFAMAILAFIGGFVRQSGTYGPGMAMGFLLIFLVCLDRPGTVSDASNLFLWLMSGGALGAVLILLSWAFIPFSPFRRSTAYTWKAMSDWITLLSATFSQEVSSERPVNELDEKELALREELDKSRAILSRKQALAHARKNRLTYQLVELRRIVSSASPAVSALHAALEGVKKENELPVKGIHYILENIGQATHRIAISIISNRREDVYAAHLALKRIKNNLEVLRLDLSRTVTEVLAIHIINPLEEIIGYLEEALAVLDQISERSGRMTFFMRNFVTGMTIPQKLPVIRFELNPKSFAFRYSLRLALAMGIGIAVYKIFEIPHGYWIAMTTLIILQPEFGATRTKAWRRLKGTILGATVGSLVYLFPLPSAADLVIVVVSAFIFSYYLIRNYAISAFFITLMIIALYHQIEPVVWQVGVARILNTIGGAGLALLGGYAFFPLWERYRFPALFTSAVEANKIYFDKVMEMNHRRAKHSALEFVKYRREAEVNNSNAFRSLQRMKEEPRTTQANLEAYYVLTGYTIRITRLVKMLNQQLIDQPTAHEFPSKAAYQELIGNILDALVKREGTDHLARGKKLPPPDELIRNMEAMLGNFQITTQSMELNIKALLENISKEVVGLYYAVSRLERF